MWTVGHSTRSLDELVALVRAHRVELIADVRTLPRSRRHPQFDAGALAASLGAAGLGYVHLPGLGGLRRERPGPANRALEHPAFRAYADYMQTADFARHLDGLVALARRQAVAFMCAEADWRHCHRSLLADALVARGEAVRHILTPERAEPHVLREIARVRDGRVSYPGEPELF